MIFPEEQSVFDPVADDFLSWVPSAIGLTLAYGPSFQGSRRFRCASPSLCIYGYYG